MTTTKFIWVNDRGGRLLNTRSLGSQRCNNLMQYSPGNYFRFLSRSVLSIKINQVPPPNSNQYILNSKLEQLEE